jgi:GAF domain-containing protein
VETLEQPAAGVPEDDLLALLASSADLGAFLDELVHLAARQVPQARACGLTLERAPTGTTVACTGPLALAADEWQYAEGDGPCLRSMWDGVVVRADDMAAEDRWGDYPAHCLSIGVRSSLSLPLVVADRSRGALNFYCDAPAVHGAEAERTAGRWAARAAGALSVALRLADSDARAEALAEGMDSRTVIGTAIGLVMAQERCSREQAFGLLKLASQRRNTKLRDVAAGIVAQFEQVLPDQPPRW